MLVLAVQLTGGRATSSGSLSCFGPASSIFNDMCDNEWRIQVLLENPKSGYPIGKLFRLKLLRCRPGVETAWSDAEEKTCFLCLEHLNNTSIAAFALKLGAIFPLFILNDT